jgi:hypothetical protein
MSQLFCYFLDCACDLFSRHGFSPNKKATRSGWLLISEFLWLRGVSAFGCFAFSQKLRAKGQ